MRHQKPTIYLIAIMMAMSMIYACKTNKRTDAAVGPHSFSSSPGGQETVILSHPNPMTGKKGVKEMDKKVRKARFAGSWYEGTKDALEKYVNETFDNVSMPVIPTEIGQKIVALISPHAGHRFSGPTAAIGFKAIREQKITRVILLGPSHRYYVRGAALPDATHFETPIGEVPLDTEIIESLAGEKHFNIIGPAHANEHSLEIQLPFLQVALKEFMLVPIEIGDITPKEAHEIATILLNYIHEHTLIVVSSDFTHFGPNYDYLPFTSDVKANLDKLDHDAFKAIKSLNVEQFFEYRKSTGITVCGFFPISVLMAMMSPETKVVELGYTTSGAMLGDYENSVSYFSIAFIDRPKKEKPSLKGTNVEQQDNHISNPMASPKPLTDEEKKTLLKLSRHVLDTYIRKEEVVDPIKEGYAITDRLKENSGAFVTLKINGQLRGCIGSILPVRPLYEEIVLKTIASSTQDSRFPEVTVDELEKIDIEISVLTPPVPVDGWKDIVVGKHGIILEKFGHGATFLPQVAPEQGWDVAETLTHLSMKAGLSPDAWKEGASFKVYEAIVFGEKEK